MGWARAQRSVLLLAAMLLACQPLFGLILQSGDVHAAGASPLGGPLLICTANGAVVADEQGPLPAPGHQGPVCACCSLGCFAGCGAVPVLSLDTDTTVLQFVREAGGVSAQDDGPAPHPRSKSHSQRGPPPVAA